MSSIDIFAKQAHRKTIETTQSEAIMTSSLHVSLPDEMRAYVDLRTNGTKAFATPSEYVRALIRIDMEKESERLYVFRELLKSKEDIKHGRLYSFEEVEARSKAFLEDEE